MAFWDGLTKNWAFISTTAKDPGLRALELPCSPRDAVPRATSVLAGLPRWMIVTVNGPEGKLHAVHRTWFWRFDDDVHLQFEPLGEGRCLMTGESRSRVGKGDLGQNARNLKEARAAIAAAFPETARAKP